MAYALLLLFFVTEYVRPAQYIGALMALHLNSAVPLLAFVGATLGAAPGTIQRVVSDPTTIKILGIYGLVWMSVFTADVTERAADAQVILLGFIIIFFVVALTVDTIGKIKGVIKTLIFVHVVVAALNPDMFTDSGTRHYITTGSFLGDGNDFALSLDVVIPLCLFLLLDSSQIARKAFWGVALAVLVAGVVVTQSRGGTIGLAAMGAYYWSKSTNKLPMAMIGTVAVAGIVAMAPGAYFQRLSTIGDMTEGSTAGRLSAWNAALRMAADNPLFGVGAAHFGIKIGNEYRPEGFVGSGMTAHSIYFLALGELGLPGLALIIALIWSNLAANRRLAKEIRARGAPAAASTLQLLASMSAAMIALATAGAFLSALYYPHIYVLCGLMTATRAVVRRDVSESAAVATVTPASPALALHWSLRSDKRAWNAGAGERRP